MQVNGTPQRAAYLFLASVLVSVMTSAAAYGHAVVGARPLAPAADPGTWSRGAAMPTERGEVGAAAVDGRIYVVGAYSGATDANEVYDPVADSWSGASPLPTGRSGIGAAVLAGRIHVLGGEADHTFDEHEAYDPTNIVEVFR